MAHYYRITETRNKSEHPYRCITGPLNYKSWESALTAAMQHVYYHKTDNPEYACEGVEVWRKQPDWSTARLVIRMDFSMLACFNPNE